MTSNVHTHSVWCDGLNTAREMAYAAVALGFTDLGFSSHSPSPFDPTCSGVLDQPGYRAEIAALRREYRGKLGILCGIEQDYYTPVNRADYDYIIGSVHYIALPRGVLFAADDNYNTIDISVRDFYHGDSIAMTRDFYALVAKNAQVNKPDIIGHFDLIAKFNSGNAIFDEQSKAYQDIALAAANEVIDVISQYGGIIEVNAGTMARGLRDVPYPAPFLLRHMADRNARVIITTDSHRASTLDAGFDRALEFVKDAGFKSMTVLKDGKFVDISI